jgi:hypothetical protein
MDSAVDRAFGAGGRNGARCSDGVQQKDFSSLFIKRL